MPKPSEPVTSRLDPAIKKLLDKLEKMEPDTDSYDKATKQLSALYKLRESEMPETRALVDPNTALLALTNIVGIILVIKHEHFNVITSKAFNMVRPPR